MRLTVVEKSSSAQGILDLVGVVFCLEDSSGAMYNLIMQKESNKQNSKLNL